MYSFMKDLEKDRRLKWNQKSYESNRIILYRKQSSFIRKPLTFIRSDVQVFCILLPHDCNCNMVIITILKDVINPPVDLFDVH